MNDRIGFFSQGDCILTRARFFRGHEWITYHGNDQLNDEDRFGDAQLQLMANGNRRVDYPKELLVHLDAGVYFYVTALLDHTSRVDVQPHHFLLGSDDSELEAAGKARRHILDVTERALVAWSDERSRALTLLGQAQHTVQDSFSAAHTVRRATFAAYGQTPEEFRETDALADAALDAAGTESGTERIDDEAPPCRGACGCIERVKAYVERAPGHREGVLFHGTDKDSIGHITSQDSIYREGRDCHRPLTPDEVWDCLNDNARQAVQGTAAYLRMVLALVRSGNVGPDFEREPLETAFEGFMAGHLVMCDEL